METTYMDVIFEGQCGSEGEPCLVCSGPVTTEEQNYLARNDFLELGSDGDYHEKSTLADSDSDWDSDARTMEELKKGNEIAPAEGFSRESLTPKFLPQPVISSRSPSKRENSSDCKHCSIDEAPKMVWPGQCNTVQGGAETTVMESNPGKSLKTRRNTLSRVIKSIKSMKAKVHKSK